MIDGVISFLSFDLPTITWPAGRNDYFSYHFIDLKSKFGPKSNHYTIIALNMP